jgi:hypothetical protein
MIHELLGEGDRRIDKPHIQHDKEADKEEGFPMPRSFEFRDGIIAVVLVINDKQQKWEESELNRNLSKSAIPRYDGEDKD